MTYEKRTQLTLRHKPLKAQLAYQVRYWRRARQLTQSELADRVGVTRATISAVEREVANPSLELMDAMAKALGREPNLSWWSPLRDRD